jgi:hypothetical protein
MIRNAGPVLAVVVALVAPGCASAPHGFPPDDAVRPRATLPPFFAVLEAGTPRPARPGEGCRSPLFDATSGATLLLERSRGGRGDYSNLDGRLHLATGELVRIDCATGRALGVVPVR